MGVDVSKCIDKSVKHYASNNVKHDDKSFLIIYKNHGKFISVKILMLILWILYLVIKLLKCDVSGFPNTSINNVVNTLEDSKISYQIIDVDKDPVIKDFGKINTYSKYLDMSFKNINNINYIVLNNLEIEIKKEYQNNNYLNYYTKYKLINLLERRMLNEI